MTALQASWNVLVFRFYVAEFRASLSAVMKPQSSLVRRPLDRLSAIDQTTGSFPLRREDSNVRYTSSNPREVSDIVRSKSRAAPTVVSARSRQVLWQSCISHGLRSSRSYILQIAWCRVGLHRLTSAG